MYTKLKELRIKKKYTVEDMGKLLALSPSYYWQLENGTRNLYYDQAIKIAQVFKKKPDQIFFEDHKNKESLKK